MKTKVIYLLSISGRFHPYSQYESIDRGNGDTVNAPSTALAEALFCCMAQRPQERRSASPALCVSPSHRSRKLLAYAYLYYYYNYN